MKYNWQHSDWPNFHFELQDCEGLLRTYLQNAGKLEGALRSLKTSERDESIVELLTAEAIKTSEIEGEFLSRADVASSIRKQLGMTVVGEYRDRRAQGIAEAMVSARNTFDAPLTEAALFEWHTSLLAHNQGLRVGSWRTHEDPMQIVSGAMGFERVHFEAPPSSVVEREMTHFLEWFNSTAPQGPDELVHAPVRAAIAHLYFESIHPFEDGNGRIGRIVAEKALAQTTGYPGLSSLSHTIEQNKKEYYRQLEKAQRSNEVSDWVNYFVGTVVDGQKFAQSTVDFTLMKSRYFDRYSSFLNAAQLKAVQRMFSEGPAGFEGGMTASKYSRLARVSKATGTRHLSDLLKLGAFTVEGHGRSTRYQLCFDAL